MLPIVWYKVDKIHHRDDYSFNHSSGYFPKLLAKYCQTIYNDVSTWLVKIHLNIIFHIILNFLVLPLLFFLFSFKSVSLLPSFLIKLPVHLSLTFKSNIQMNNTDHTGSTGFKSAKAAYFVYIHSNLKYEILFRGNSSPVIKL